MDIKELEALARDATPGRWKAKRLRDSDGVAYATSYTAHIDIDPVCMIWAPEDNAEQTANAFYIAAANPQTVLKLIEIIRAQQTIVESVAHIGVDFGYGPFNLDVGEPHTEIAIRDAREALAKATEVLGDSHE